MYIEQEDILKHISAKPFHLISEAADELGVEAYVIGGYVRDIFLHRPSKDIDVVAIGSGIENIATRRLLLRDRRIRLRLPHVGQVAR